MRLKSNLDEVMSFATSVVRGLLISILWAEVTKNDQKSVKEPGLEPPPSHLMNQTQPPGRHVLCDRVFHVRTLFPDSGSAESPVRNFVQLQSRFRFRKSGHAAGPAQRADHGLRALHENVLEHFFSNTKKKKIRQFRKILCRLMFWCNNSLSVYLSSTTTTTMTTMRTTTTSMREIQWPPFLIHFSVFRQKYEVLIESNFFPSKKILENGKPWFSGLERQNGCSDDDDDDDDNGDDGRSDIST